MLFQDLAIDDNVIEVDNNESIQEESKYLVHEGAKCGQHIHEAKGHRTHMICRELPMPSLARPLQLCELDNTRSLS